MKLVRIRPMLLLATLLASPPVFSEVDGDELGAWYMLFWSTRFDDSRWGLQGDVQYRNWDTSFDLEQLLIRGGLTYSPGDSGLLLTLGYASITNSDFDSSGTSTHENRIYQEALLPHRIGRRVYIRHRFRLEQRWVENEDFRTRFRYALFADVPLNRESMDPGAVYLAMYNEFFVNGHLNIGDGKRVDRFDRNRLYAAIGYVTKSKWKVQGGYMYQWASSVDKGQLQLSLHGSF